MADLALSSNIERDLSPPKVHKSKHSGSEGPGLAPEVNPIRTRQPYLGLPKGPQWETRMQSSVTGPWNANLTGLSIRLRLLCICKIAAGNILPVQNAMVPLPPQVAEGLRGWASSEANDQPRQLVGISQEGSLALPHAQLAGVPLPPVMGRHAPEATFTLTAAGLFGGGETSWSAFGLSNHDI